MCGKIIKLKGNKALAFTEYVALVTFIIAAFMAMEGYILRGLIGNWKKASDTFGHGRQYDPRDFGTMGDGGGTLECLYYYDMMATPITGFWMDKKYFDANCKCYLPRAHSDYSTDCEQCRQSARTTADGVLCNQQP